MLINSPLFGRTLKFYDRQPLQIEMLYLTAIIVWILPSLMGHPVQRPDQSGSVIQAYEGDNIEYNCVKKLQFAESNVEWYLNGSFVDKNDHQRLRLSVDRNALYIDGVHSEDGGLWTIMARSQNASSNITDDDSGAASDLQTWCSFTLRVLEDHEELLISYQLNTIPETSTFLYKFENNSTSKTEVKPKNSPPKFKRLDQMKEKKITVTPVGMSVVFKCPAYGYPLPVIHWSKNGEEIPRHTASVKQRKWSLELERINSQDSGEYNCAVSNLYGSVNFTFRLTVLATDDMKPKLLGMQNVTVRTGDTARLNCSMAPLNRRSTKIEWLRSVSVNGSFFDSTGAPYFEQLEVDDSNGRDRRILSIENVTREDNGRYVCKVVNKYGIAVQSAWLSAVDVGKLNISNDQSYFAISTGTVGGAVILLTIVSAYFIRRKFRQQPDKREADLKSSPVLNKRCTNLTLSDEPQGVFVNSSTSRQTARDSLLRTDLESKKELPPPTKNEQIGSVSEFPRENIVLGPCLNNGTFGKVIQAQAYGILQPGVTTTVAVRMLNEDDSAGNLPNVVAQVEFMKSVGKHENIINLLGYCTNGTPFYIIVEFAANGNLLNLLRQQRFVNNNESPPNSDGNGFSQQFVSYNDMVSFGHQVVVGMAYLESRKVVHRSLTASNVLVDVGGVLKITGFKISRDIRPFENCYNKSKWAKWMAPECLGHSVFTSQSDVWSFGILLWEIVSLGDCPYPGLPNTEKLFELICGGLRMEKPIGSSPSLYKIMSNCWQHEPKERPTFDSLASQFANLKETTSLRQHLTTI